MKTMKADSLYYWTSLLHPKMKQASQLRRGQFSSVDDKYQQLAAMCHDSVIVGGPAREVLTLGGDKHVFWFDIDTCDASLISQWLDNGCPIPKDAFVMVPSTTGKAHMYVVSDRPLENDECFGMYEHLVRTIDDYGLVLDADRVYGPKMRNAIYLPYAAQGRPVMPQQLVKDLTGKFIIPGGLSRVPYMGWRDAKKKLREELLMPRVGSSMQAAVGRVLYLTHEMGAADKPG